MIKWHNIPDDISKYQGFVYIIEHRATGKFYIGKKFFWKRKTLPPLKGRKNKRHFRVESDWKDYWGSSNALLADVEKYGKGAFSRRILHHCDDKWWCAYLELITQLDYEIFGSNNCYNEMINVRLRKRK